MVPLHPLCDHITVIRVHSVELTVSLELLSFSKKTSEMYQLIMKYYLDSAGGALHVSEWEHDISNKLVFIGAMTPGLHDDSFMLKEHVALDRTSWSIKSVCNRFL